MRQLDRTLLILICLAVSTYLLLGLTFHLWRSYIQVTYIYEVTGTIEDMSVRGNGSYASIKLTGYRSRFILCFVDDKGSEYFPLIKKGQEVRISHQKWSTVIVEFTSDNLTLDKEQLKGYRKNIFSNVPVIFVLLVVILFLTILLFRRPRILFSTNKAKSNENQNNCLG